ncbi:glycosyltransferase family protein [Hwanghaeella sp.]|uniref:glycosyltransferase family protein n=1 Tax=Hwanghaeella sp. TaxID=2605943 RepID=UPI003CCBC0D9
MTDKAQDAYDRGDYQFAARHAADPLLKGLALIMIGNQLDGLPMVSGIDTADANTPPEVAAVIAFGHWLNGSDEEARAILRTRGGDLLASEFLDLLSNGPIPCLFQSARAPLLASYKRARGFSVTTIGSGGQDCDIDLDECDEEALSDAVSKAAFLFGFDFAAPPPPRPQDCQTPYLFHLTDPDVHVLTGLHPVRRYDRAVAGTSGQAALLRAITGVTSVSAPFFGGLSAFHPSLAGFISGPKAERGTDLFFSGSYGTPIYHEKPARFFAVSQIAEPYRIDLFDSTRPLSDYAAALRNARFALVSVRAPGSFSTRAMQALECGAMVLCEADSGVLDFFPGADWGIFTYRPDHIAEDVAQHLARYPDYADRLRPERVVIEQRLAALSPGSPEAEERWLKYAAFQALLVRQGGLLAPCPRVVEPPLDWFTVRGLPAPALPDAVTSQAAAYSALALQARMGGAPPTDWLTEDGAFTPVGGDPAPLPGLKKDLPGAFLRVAETWVNRQRSSFEAACAAIWSNRASYADQDLDGLAVPDFWLAVFLNRLGLPLGRLYEDAVGARTGHLPRTEGRLLIAALGMVGAERAWADGDHLTALERGEQVSGLDPSNHASVTLRLLCALRKGDVPTTDLLDDWHDRIGHYPWHLPRVMALLTAKPDIDPHLSNGRLHEVYLRFIQRMRDSRPLLSPARLPAGAAAYTAWKLELSADATEADVLDRLRNDNLLLTDAETANALIVEPVLVALATRS